MVTTSFGFACRYRLSGNGLQYADAAAITGLGNTVEVYRISRQDGESHPFPRSVTAKRLEIRDAAIKNREWHRRMLAPFRYGTASEPEDYEIEDLLTGERWIVREAIVIEEPVDYSAESDELVVQSIALAPRIVERAGAFSDGGETKPVTAALGDVVLHLPGEENPEISAEYASTETPGIDGAYSPWVGGSGWKDRLEFHLVRMNGRDPEEDLKKIEALVRKTDGPSPPVVTFRFGDRTFPCRVVRLKPQPIRRDRSGKALIVRGEIEIEEVHIPGTSRTSRAEKGLQTYQVAGMSETWEYIAHTVFNDESLADALADYNPRPADFSPILPQGTVVMIPPWAFARSYQTTEGRRPWL